MMKLEMNLIKMPRLRKGKFSIFFCVDDAIATIAAYYQRSYEYMYRDALYYRYDKKNEYIGKSIYVPYLFQKQLRECCGITMEFQNHTEHPYDLVKKELDAKNPVFMAINAYYCPWDWRYGEIEDGGHAIILNGYDEQNQSLLCIDPYYDQIDLVLPLHLFSKGIMQIATFRKENYDKNIDNESFLQESLQNMVDKPFYSDAEKLAADIGQNFLFEYEISNYDPLEEISGEEMSKRVALEAAFTALSNNRQRYAVMLKLIGEKSPGLKDMTIGAIDRLIAFAEQWDMLRYMIMKGIMLKKASVITEYAPEKIKIIALSEKEYFEELVENKEKGLWRMASDRTCDEQLTISEIFHYELNQFCNNEGIGDFENTSANLNDKGDYFLLDDFSEKMSFLDMSFQVSGLHNGKADNVICQGQKLKVLPDYYIACVILGCSDFGQCIDRVRFVYEDGKEEECRIEMPEWQPELQYGEPEGTAFVLRSVECYEGSKSINSDGKRLYVRKLKLNQEKRLISLMLPQTPCLHIFSLFLAK
ncbi:MAG: C39 family peptidase [Lachnospiraceae bacterium]|nr:C39 family peptidase [Lachnospiraceae bacterium]